MANTNFTAEQQTAIDNYNTQKQKLSERWLWNTWTQRVALNQLRDTWVGSNANGFFVIESTPTATSGTTTKPTQQVSQNWNNQTVQTTVSNQNNSNNQNQNTIQQQWALKPLSQDYYNQSGADNLSTIVSNLNNYRQTNPEYFTDYDSFKKNFSYDARNDAQKQTLDTWYNGYQRWMELNSKAVSDLATQYKNWLISDSDLEQLRTANQWKYGEVMDYINKQTILSKYDEENTPSASTNPFQWIIDQYYNNLLTASQTNASSEMFDNYKNQMNSPEMTEMSDQLADLDGQLKEYQNELNRIKSDVERRYEWTWASKSKINAIIADESYKIQEAMNTASLQYNTLATKYNNRMTQYQNEFQLQLQEYQFNMQQRNQQMQELWFVMDLMNFETNEQKDEREWNNYVRQYDFQYWNINSKDEASRRRAIENAVDSVLTEFSGITMMRSREQMVEDIMNLVDGGMSLWEAITKNIREPIMQKPEYQIWKAQQYWTWTVSIGWNNYTFDANGNLTLWWTWNIDYNNLPSYNAVTELYKQTTLNSYINDPNNKAWMIWGQCWSFVNDYLNTLWIDRLYKDPIDSKLAVTNSTTPTRWSIAVIDWRDNPNASDVQKQYGHVAIVTEVNWNKVKVLESNRKWDKTIHENTYDISKIAWFFDPSISKEQAISTQQAQNQAQSYNDSLIPYYNKYLTWKGITKEDWSTIEQTTSRTSFLNEATAYKKKQDEELSATAQTLINLIDDIDNMSQRNYLWVKANVPYTAWATYKAKIDQLLDSAALQKLIDLKSQGATFGALSDNELSFITNASTYLNTNLKYSDFMEWLKNMKDSLQKWINTTEQNNVTTQQTQTTQDWSQWQSSSTANGISSNNWKYCYIYNWQQYCI